MTIIQQTNGKQNREETPQERVNRMEGEYGFINEPPLEPLRGEPVLIHLPPFFLDLLGKILPELGIFGRFLNPFNGVHSYTTKELVALRDKRWLRVNNVVVAGIIVVLAFLFAAYDNSDLLSNWIVIVLIIILCVSLLIFFKSMLMKIDINNRIVEFRRDYTNFRP